jgi:branched-chain amino acid transport system permease protein
MLANLIGGIAIGSVYALIAIGAVLVYRTTGVVNFAQGELVTIGAYAYVFASTLSSSAAVTMGFAILCGVVSGAVFFFVVHYLLRGRQELSLVVGTLALLTLVQATARLYATDRPYRAATWLFADRSVKLGSASLPVNSLVIIGVTALAAVGLLIWFTRTIIGKAMAAVAEDPLRSAMAGIPVRAILLLSWTGAGAGVLISPVTGVYPTMGGSLILAAVVGAVVGGFDSILGALVGGLLIGLLQTFAVVLVGGSYRDIVVFGLLMLVLMVRPSGLFGSPELRRV